MNDKIRPTKLNELLLKESILDRDDQDLFTDDDHSILIDRGYECVETGDLDMALEIFALGLQMDGSDADSLNGMGVTFYEMGRFRASRLVLEKAASLYPDDPITMANLAGTCWEQDNIEEAIYYYCKSIELDPEIEETHLNLVNLYMEVGALFMAFITCNRCLEIFPENEEARELMDEIILSLAISQC